MSTNNKTIFEKIIAGEIPCTKVFEDADTFAFLDIKPNSIGHTLIVPKHPYRNVFELSPKVSATLMQNVVKISTAIRDGLKCDGINISMNNGSIAGQIVFHAHIHIIPRYEKIPEELQKLSHEEIAKKIIEKLE